MKSSYKIFLIIFVCLSLCTPTIRGKCTRTDKQHADEKVVHCTYSQQDIERAYKRCPKRFCKDTCFFCGCPTCDHTKE